MSTRPNETTIIAMVCIISALIVFGMLDEQCERSTNCPKGTHPTLSPYKCVCAPGEEK